MGTSNSDISKLHKRIGDYLNRVSEIIIDDNKPAAIARAPVEAGISNFISVDNLPSLDDLPFIPERMRDFAYRYATEYKKLATWAKAYDVSIITVQRWLQNPGVRSYIALARLEKRFYTMARRSALENKVWERLHEFMSIKITGDNAGAVARILEFSYNILHAPENIGGREKGNFNQSIYVGASDLGSEGLSPYNSPVGRDVTPTPKQLNDLQSRLDRLKMLETRKQEMDDEVEEVEVDSSEGDG